MIKIDLSNLPLVVSPHFRKLLFDEHEYIVLKGGAGSGKSHFVAQKIIFRCLSTPRHRFLVVRKVGATLRNSVCRLFVDILTDWGWDKLFVYNKTDFTIRFLNGSEIIFVGLDDVAKLKSIHNITGVWIEESTETTEGEFDQIDLRLRFHSTDPRFYRQIILSFNPVSISHWLKKRFWDTVIDLNLVLLDHSTYLDNAFLPESYRQVFDRLKVQNPELYTVYGLGNWGSLEGLIYSNYTVIQDQDWPKLEWFDEVIYGMDFGFNNPSAVIQVGIKDRQFYEREMFYKTNVNINKLRELMPELILISRYRKVYSVPIYADSANPESIEMLASDRWNVLPAYKGPNSVYEGITLCKGLPTFVHAGSDNLIREYQSYSWKVDKNGNVLDEPVKFHDHLMDAKRYAEFTHLRQTANTFVGLGLEVML